MGLIQLSEQNSIKPFSVNWCNAVKLAGGKTNYEQISFEVENNDLMNMLGSALLYDIQQNITDAKYLDLLNGKEFTNSKGYKLKFQGIKYQLAYLIYAKYTGISNIADTFTGLVQKNRNEATPISEGQTKRERNDAQSVALNDFEIMKDFLNLNSGIYPLWICSENKNIRIPKFHTIRKTYR